MAYRLVLFSGLICFFLFSWASLPAQNAPTETLQGRLQSLVVDYFETSEYLIEHILITDSNQRFRLHFKPGIIVPKAGSRISVRGKVVDEDVFVEWVSVLAQPRDNPTTGEQKICVLLINFQNNPTENVTKEQVEQMFFAPSNSIDHYWREASYGKTWATGDVFGWYTLPINETCDPGLWRQLAIEMADPDVNYLEYNRLFILVPGGGGCGWGGLGTLGTEIFQTDDGWWETTTSWCRSEYYTDPWYAIAVSCHEGGHNFGLMHANSIDYGDEVLGKFDCGACGGSMAEYGDRFDVLGAWDNGHYNAQHKVALGWFEPGNVVEVTGSGLYAIDAYATASNNPKVLKVLRGNGSTSTEWIWLEWRAPVGFDATLNYYSGYNFNGVLGHFEWGWGNSATYLLDFTPTDGDFHNAALVAGQTWTDYYTGLVIKPLGVQGETFWVQIGGEPLAKISVTPSVIVGGAKATGEVSLNSKAPPGGVMVTLSTDRPDLVTIPSNVTIAGGEKSVKFDVLTQYVTNSVKVKITSSLFNTDSSVLIELVPVSVKKIRVDPNSITGGWEATGTVELNGPAPPGGLLVSLQSQYPSIAQVPPNVQVSEGQDFVNFPVTTSAVGATTSVKITATKNNDKVTTKLEVTSAEISKLELVPSHVTSGSTSKGVVTLTGPAPKGGVEVKLKSGNTKLAKVPSTLIVPEGHTSASFDIQVGSTSSTKGVAIFATRFNTKSAVLIVSPK